MSKGEAWCLAGLSHQKSKEANATSLPRLAGLKNPVNPVLLLIL
jgi:hypothetical protein